MFLLSKRVYGELTRTPHRLTEVTTYKVFCNCIHYWDSYFLSHYNCCFARGISHSVQYNVCISAVWHNDRLRHNLTTKSIVVGYTFVRSDMNLRR